jgi:hypothetical protein
MNFIYVDFSLSNNFFFFFFFSRRQAIKRPASVSQLYLSSSLFNGRPVFFFQKVDSQGFVLGV